MSQTPRRIISRHAVVAPKTVEWRQIENIKAAIEFARRDDIAWLGHFDNDEFLHAPSHANVGMRLARLDDDVMCARP